ncbi:MAG TPA: Ig-like domain-containing protein [Turneriella sp.]|nr:Ig-like domain-containing protein [Turneriella sp.]
MIHRLSQTFIFIPIIFLSCSLLKTGQGANCLNPTSGCFRADLTAPRITASDPADGTSLNFLDSISVTVSEKLRSGDSPTNWSLTGAGTNNLTITSVSFDETNYVYTLSISGNVRNGLIQVTALANDFAGNSLQNPSFSFTGNVDIGIAYTISTNYITSGTGFNQSTVNFHHDFADDNDNSWKAYLNSSDCSGTQVAAGTGFVASGIAKKYSPLRP